MKKHLSISTLGRRNKQQILKDWLRPEPASTISSEIGGVSGGGFNGVDQTGCAGPPPGREPCAEATPDLTNVVAAGWPTTNVGHWAFYPGPDDPDLLNFNNSYLTEDFPFIETLPDGAALEYRYATFAGAVLTTPLWQYRVHVVDTPGPGVSLEYFGAGWLGSNATLVGLSSFLQENLPFEALVRVHILDLPDGRNSSNGLAFGLEEKDEADFESGHNMLPLQQYVSLNWKPLSGPDTMTVFHNAATSQIPVDDFVTGGTYMVRMHVTATGVTATLWNASGNEEDGFTTAASLPHATQPVSGFAAHLGPGLITSDCGPQFDTPCLDYSDDSQAVIFSALFINPTSSVYPAQCDEDLEDGVGVHFDTLIKKTNYWIPATPSVSEYRQVYFDGIPVEEGTHYWLDGLKLHPNDPAIFADTLATATVVVS